jgi:hypothetical protein
MHRDLLEISFYGRFRRADCRVDVFYVDLKAPLGHRHTTKAAVVQLATKPHPSLCWPEAEELT